MASSDSCGYCNSLVGGLSIGDDDEAGVDSEAGSKDKDDMDACIPSLLGLRYTFGDHMMTFHGKKPKLSNTVFFSASFLRGSSSTMA